ncbi:hypothetical protein ACQ4PT_016432 [Festuca glaucescens]
MATSGGAQGCRMSYEEMRYAELLALPPHGSELFVCGLASKTTEESLRKFCHPLEIYDIKLKNNGCAYITFTTKITLDIMEGMQKKDKMIQLALVPSEHWLLVQNVPKRSSKEELRSILGPGVMNIDDSVDSQDLTAESVSLCVEYYNHACAEYAKKKLSASDFKLHGSHLAVSWALVPQGAKKPETAHKNLPLDPYGAYGCGSGNNKPKRIPKRNAHFQDGYILQDLSVSQPSSTRRGDCGSGSSSTDGGPSGNRTVKRARKSEVSASGSSGTVKRVSPRPNRK